MKVRRRAILFRSLGVMFNAGIPISRAFEHLGEHLEHAEDRGVAKDIGNQLRSGKSLDQAMRGYRGVFSNLQLSLIRLGCETGGLGSVLTRLADHEEKSLALTLKVRSALTYPAVLFSVCLAFVVLLPPYVLGGILQLIESFQIEVPWPTRVVMFLSDAVQSWGFYLLLSLLAVGAWKLYTTLWIKPSFRRNVLLFMLDLPLVGDAIRALAVTRFTRALEIQLEVGLPLTQALNLSAAAADNVILKEQIGHAVQRLIAGENLAECLDGTDFFSPLLVQTVALGQESGRLSWMLARVADMLEFDLDHRIEVLTAAAEPLIMLLMGCIAGFVVIATMMPFAQVIQTL